jgi:anti-anti-sigma factor
LPHPALIRKQLCGGHVNREFLIDVHDGAAHVLFAGELDALSEPAIARAIGRALALPLRAVVIDLDAVTFIDSTGLQAIVNGYRDAAAFDIGFRITPAAHPVVARILKVTGVDELTVECNSETYG